MDGRGRRGTRLEGNGMRHESKIKKESKGK